MQEDILLSGSIADNVSFFSQEIDYERIVIVTKKARIYQDIIRMPMGFESLVGDIGSALSGGQKQRLILARALYRSPKILVLDEATIHVDSEMEKSINENISTEAMTKVIVAHREDTIRSADFVFKLEQGQIIDSFCPNETVHA